MTTEESEGINRALGRVQGLLQSLMDQWGRQEQAAAVQRQRNLDRLEQLERTLDRLATDLQGVQQDVAELRNEAEPIITAYTAEQNQRIGRRSVWVVIGAAVTGLSAVAYRALADIWHSLPPTHPPSP